MAQVRVVAACDFVFMAFFGATATSRLAQSCSPVYDVEVTGWMGVLAACLGGNTRVIMQLR